MINKKIGTTASLFGAALTSMLVAPELQADVVSLSFNPGTNSSGGLDPIDILEIAGATEFSQWNDSVGKTLYAAGALTGVAAAQFSQTLSAGTFFGQSGIFAGSGLSASATGVFYVGFRTSSGNVGWFSMDLGGLGGTITYLEGAYGTMGENVHVGSVPAPGALALLALGAVGVRRNRRKRVA